MISAEDFDQLVLARRKAKYPKYRPRCKPGEECPGKQNLPPPNPPPRGETQSPEPSRFGVMQPRPYQRASLRNMYGRQIIDIESHILDVQRELDDYADQQASGVTGLGLYVNEGTAILNALQTNLSHARGKQYVWRTLSTEDMRAAYSHIVQYYDTSGLTHPEGGQQNTAGRSKVGLLEDITSVYNVPPGDVLNMPDAYPLQILV